MFARKLPRPPALRRTKLMVQHAAIGLLLGCSTTGGHLSAQSVAGVEFGRTHIQEVRRIRGAPDLEGMTEDGSYRFLRYGQYAFYFGADSSAAAARVFTSATRTEVEAIFGEPRYEERLPDLSIRVAYSDTVLVSYQRAGRLAQFIEYSGRTADGALLDRFFAIQDSLMAVHDSLDDAARRQEIERGRRASLETARAVVDLCERHDDRVTETELRELFDPTLGLDSLRVAGYEYLLETGTICGAARENERLWSRRLAPPP